jgi:hypothetical protein
MPFPVVPALIAAGIGVLLFGGKKAAPGVAPAPAPSPGYTPPTYTPPTQDQGGSGGSGGGLPPYVAPSPGDPGYVAPATPGDENQPGYVGPAANATGVNADPGILSTLGDLFSSSGPIRDGWGHTVGAPHHHYRPVPQGSRWVWSPHARAWVLPYHGHAQGHPPPAGIVAHRPLDY